MPFPAALHAGLQMTAAAMAGPSFPNSYDAVSGGRRKRTVPGHRHRSHEDEPSPAAVALQRQLQLALALKYAKQQAAALQSTSASSMQHQHPLVWGSGGIAPAAPQSPWCSSDSGYASSGSSPSAAGCTSIPELPLSLSPRSSSGCNAVYPSSGLVGAATPPLQYYNVTPALDQHALQEMLLLQQQQAEVDAAINTMLALRQQLAAAAAPAAMPAPAPTAAPLFPGAAPVSRATAALAPQLDMPLYGTHPAPAAAALAPVSSGSPTAAAQLHLAQLQAEQQQLLDVEQQLQLRLQAEVARLVALG